MLQTANSFLRNPFRLNWPLKSRNDWTRKERTRKFSLKPSIGIHDIPVRILKQIISYVIVDTPISSLRRVCRSWNTAINNIIYEEIIKQSPELTLLMRCQTNAGELVNLEYPLQRSGLTNKCKIEFFPRLCETLEKQLFVDSYIFIEFFLLYKIGKENVNKKKLTRYSMSSFKFDNPIINTNSVIDLDLAFQYIPYEPLTFRLKDISFSPIYLLNLLKIKNKVNYRL